MQPKRRHKSQIFTANGVNNEISVLDVISHRVLKPVPIGEQPWGVVAHW
jgi:YVTN family beta-propeller protein